MQQLIKEKDVITFERQQDWEHRAGGGRSEEEKRWKTLCNPILILKIVYKLYLYNV